MSYMAPLPQPAASHAAQSSTASPLPPPPSSLRTSSSIPRELLTWLQALGLGNIVKNPRRDLSNGYAIAQICAHYWPQVPLHSFANGVSTASKQSNWYVLQKVMRRHDMDVSPAMVRGMVDGNDDCAVAFLKQLYTVFTGKTIEETPVPLAEPLVEVPSKDVPRLTPSTTNNAASRARQAADNGASTTSTASRFNADNRKGERLMSYGAGVSLDGYGGGGGGQAAGAGPRAVGVTLPPILPPPPAEAAFSAAALASGKPALNVTVRPAGQVSTVMPAQPAATAAAGAAAASGKNGARSHPPGTSLATRWFCATARAALPAEAVEALVESGGREEAATGASDAALTSLLRWLSASSDALDGTYTDSREGEEIAKEEEESEVALRLRVWRALQSSAHELADVVLQRGPHGLDILVDGLFDAVRRTAPCDAAGREIRSGVVFVRGVLQLCSALLLHLSDEDVHHAVRCFQAYFLPSDAFAAAVRNVKWCVARDYAELVVTALPLNRGVDAAVLESLWGSLESVVGDASAEEEEEEEGEEGDGVAARSTRSEVSLLVLAHALVEVILPLHTGATATLAGQQGRITSGGTRTSSVSTRRASQRARSPHASLNGAAAAMEEKAFDALVVRLSYQCCADSLLLVQHARSASQAATQRSDTVLLAEAAAALAIDMLRVEVRTPLVGDLACGDSFLDVYHALFATFEAHSDDEESGEVPPPQRQQQQQQRCLRHPTLSVLRARWLRWCLQRQWQFGLSARASLAVWQPSPRHSPSLGGSTGGLSDGEASPVADKETWDGGEEGRALRHSLQVVCTELLLSSSVEDEGNAAAEERQVAKVLMACAMAEALPFLPAKYKQLGAALQRGSEVDGGGDGGNFLNLLTTPGDDNEEDSNNNSSSQQQPQQQQSADRVYAEAVAKAVMHVFMREATPAQMRALLRATSPNTSQLPPGELAVATVTLPHAFVGPLTASGPLVLRSDVLLLVKAMLSVLEALNAASAKATAADRDVAAVARRLGARAAVMAREGQVQDALAARISWMHALLVDGRRAATPPTSMAATGAATTPAVVAASSVDAASPLLPATVTDSVARRTNGAGSGFDADTVSQWHNVILECWDTFMVVLQAATLRLRQRGGAAVSAAGGGPVDPAVLLDALGATLLQCAQQSQEVVRCLERELSAALPGRGVAPVSQEASMNASAAGRGEGVTLNSALLSGPMASFVAGTSPEEVQAAVGWMWTVVGGS